MSTQQETQWDRERAQSYSRWSSLSARLVHAPFARKIVASVGPLAAGSTIVDLGTGPGMLAVELHKLCPHAKIIGVDPSDDMLKIARANAAKAGMADYEGRLGAAEKIPVDSDSADLVISQSSFHEWEDQRRGLAEILRVLRPGGSLVLKDYDRAWLSGWKRTLFGLFGHLHMFRFTLGDVVALLEEAGFSRIKDQGGGMQFYIQAVKP